MSRAQASGARRAGRRAGGGRAAPGDARPGDGAPAWWGLEVDPRGRVVPRTAAARRALAARAGRFALLPTSGDLLVARRTPPAGGAPARPRCVMAGDLPGVAAADLLGFVHQARLSGALTVLADGAERTVAFAAGQVRWARSSAPGERLGEVAVRLGYVTEAQVAEAVRSGVPVGKALVDRGRLAAADLWRCLHEQVLAVFQAILGARRGTFFLTDERIAELPPALAVGTQALLLDGLRRIDEMSLFRERIPGPHAALRRRRPRRPAALQPPEAAVLALVDGRRDVAAVAAAAHLTLFDATRVLHRLAEAGHVAVTPAPARRARPPSQR